MVLLWFYLHGHHVVSLVGGATARVGDPSGRLKSRQDAAEDTQLKNAKSMEQHLHRIWEGAVLYGQRHGYRSEPGWRREILNNASWLEHLNILDFLKSMGKKARLGAMLGRDTVRNKMEKGDGMTFSEFTYPLLQGWDWWHMFRNHGIQVQVGGSDQYGNIVAGMDSVRVLAQTEGYQEENEKWLAEDGRLRQEFEPMGITVPLLTTAGGEKFGKSAGNAVWLDTNMTSAFDLYGFLLRTSDQDVERYLNLFTLVPHDDIIIIMEQHLEDPGKRKAQHLLASEVLELVHGREQAKATRQEHETLRAPTLLSLLRQSARSDGNASVAQGQQQQWVATEHIRLPSNLVFTSPWSHILHHAGLTKTKSEAVRLIANGGVNVAIPVDSVDDKDGRLRFTSVAHLQAEDVRQCVIEGLLVLRLGKWKVRVIEVSADEDRTP